MRAGLGGALDRWRGGVQPGADLDAGPASEGRVGEAWDADWNAGPANAIPSTVSCPPGATLIEKPSPPPAPVVGSGKLGAPCARMHRANSYAGLLDALGFEVPLPQAAIASVQPIATRTTARQPRSNDLLRLGSGTTRWPTGTGVQDDP